MAILILFGDEISEEINVSVINAYHVLKDLLPDTVILRSGYADILLKYNYPIDHSIVELFIRASLSNQTQRSSTGKSWTFHVNFDCTDNDWDQVIATSGKTKEYLIQQLLSRSYSVMMIGFLPGFPYLGTLPTELHCPRKEEPRLNVPKGSLAIGGEQLGIYPKDSPGGWNIIGHIDVELFTPENGSLLKLGDQVQFKEIEE